MTGKAWKEQPNWEQLRKVNIWIINKYTQSHDLYRFSMMFIQFELNDDGGGAKKKEKNNAFALGEDGRVRRRRRRAAEQELIEYWWVLALAERWIHILLQSTP